MRRALAFLAVVSLSLPVACDVESEPPQGSECSSFTGSACEQIVQCCDFLEQQAGSEVSACATRRPVAQDALDTSSKEDDEECANMLDDEELSECELTCPASSGSTSGG